MISPMAAMYLALIGHAWLLSPASSVVLTMRSHHCRPIMMCSEGPGSLVRLDKLLAERGAGSRKDVDRLIRKGMVEIEDPDSGLLVVVPKGGAKLKVPWESSPCVDGFDYPPPPMLVAYRTHNVRRKHDATVPASSKMPYGASCAPSCHVPLPST